MKVDLALAIIIAVIVLDVAGFVIWRWVAVREARIRNEERLTSSEERLQLLRQLFPHWFGQDRTWDDVARTAKFMRDAVAARADQRRDGTWGGS